MSIHSALCAFKILRGKYQHESYRIGYLKERQILFAHSQFGAYLCCSSYIKEAPSVALCAVKMCRKLLKAHSNMARAALFYHIGV